MKVGIGVTCPTNRYHPALVAQWAATAASLMEGRFELGIDSGEALNEHVLGDRWPPATVRIEMMREAIDVIRTLWTGEVTDHDGDVLHRREGPGLLAAGDAAAGHRLGDGADRGEGGGASAGDELVLPFGDPRAAPRGPGRLRPRAGAASPA